MYFLGTTPSPSSRRPANAPGNLPEKRKYNCYSYSGFLFYEHSKLMCSQNKSQFLNFRLFKSMNKDCIRKGKSVKQAF